jgi:PmbA protein
MDDLGRVALALVDRAGGNEGLEAFLVHDRTFQVKTYMGEVESISSAEPRGAGVRVFDEGRAGFAYTTDMSDEGMNDVVARAREAARFATPDEAVEVAPSWEGVPADVEGLFDAAQGGVTADEKVAFAIELERTTRSADKRIRTVEEAMYADSESTVAIATSSGISGTYTSTDAWCYSYAIAAEGEDTQVGFEFDLGRGLADLDGGNVASRAAERAVGVLGARKIASARMPVVFDPYVAGQFLGVLARALIAESVQKGRSLFAGKLGERVAAPALSLIDDGRVPGAPGSAPWDAEGTPTQRTEVITAGTLRSYLYDLTSARREGRTSTGNADRAGFKSGPGPSPTNLAFEPFGGNAAQVMAGAGRALLVQDFHGVHSGANSVTGDFSVGATGRLLDNGVPGAPVKEVTIAAPMLDILNGIVAVADDRRWLPFGGSFGGATTLVAEMTVAGS